ncbi:MAG: hypothetical protein QM530_00325 [Phycisphaerales bacterium]|nr:hypothetical protein [Phycisphaerales bacterium]
MFNIKNVSKLALAALFILLLGAAQYYLERILFVDPAHISFSIINTKTLAIQERRYGSFISQIFPLVGVWLHLPLKGILFLYSISFNLFYFSAAILLHCKKQYLFSILIALYFTLCVTESYYWTNNEVHQGMVWLLLMFGFIFNYNTKQKTGRILPYLVVSILAFLAIFSHPIIILVAGSLSVFFLIEDKELRKEKKSWFYFIIILVVILTKYYFSINGSYDKQKLDTFNGLTLKMVLFFWEKQTSIDFISSCIKDYWVFLILVISGLSYLLYQRKFKLFSWVVFTCLIYYISICVIYPECTFKFYIESEWMGMSIIAVLPFLLYTISNNKPRLNVLIFSLVFSISLIRIYNHSQNYVKRLHKIQSIVRILQKNNTPKVVIIKDSRNQLETDLLMDWGLPIETLMLSNFNKNDLSVTAVQVHQNDTSSRFNKVRPGYFIAPFSVINTRGLNKDYFRFDTVQKYRIDSAILYAN